MPFPQGFEFIETIEPTRENAVAIQLLTLQDLLAGGFNKPLELANPDDPYKVIFQQRKLREHPNDYSGYTHDGQLVAYIKQNDWLIGDELPFATGFHALALHVRRALHLNPATGQWGVFGLVVSGNLEDRERDSVLADLLQRSFMDRRKAVARTVNVVLHKQDPLLRIAVSHGFVPVGKFAEAAGAPGLQQRRYQRSPPK